MLVKNVAINYQLKLRGFFFLTEIIRLCIGKWLGLLPSIHNYIITQW